LGTKKDFKVNLLSEIVPKFKGLQIIAEY